MGLKTYLSKISNRSLVKKNYSDIEDKFHHMKWAGLTKEERIELTFRLDEKYPGMMDMKEELETFNDFPKTHVPVALLAEMNSMALLNKDQSLLSGLSKSLRRHSKLVVPIGLNEDQVRQAIEDYERDMC